MPSDSSTAGLDFGALIAFVAPGFVVVHAISYHSPVARTWMAAAAEKEQGVGIFLFVVLASLSLGLVVSGLRWLIVDTVLHQRVVFKRFAVPRLELNWSHVDEKRLPVLVAIRDNHYRYFQFYANTFVAVLFWIVSRACADVPTIPILYWIVLASVSLALLLSARNALHRYVVAAQQAVRKP